MKKWKISSHKKFKDLILHLLGHVPSHLICTTLVSSIKSTRKIFSDGCGTATSGKTDNKRHLVGGKYWSDSIQIKWCMDSGKNLPKHFKQSMVTDGGPLRTIWKFEILSRINFHIQCYINTIDVVWRWTSPESQQWHNSMQLQNAHQAFDCIFVWNPCVHYHSRRTISSWWSLDFSAVST